MGSCRQEAEDVYCSCSVGKERQAKESLCACKKKHYLNCFKNCKDIPARSKMFNETSLIREKNWGSKHGALGRYDSDGKNHGSGTKECTRLIKLEDW
jgi:hypothetical protein